MDRNYYRMCEDSELINEAAYRPSAELAVVLGERLEDITAEHEANVEELKDRAKNFEIDANQLDDKVYELRMEIAKNEQIIAAMAAEIKQLKETAK
jgi:peptidoglycan hydrolase CwlO-like protein